MRASVPASRRGRGLDSVAGTMTQATDAGVDDQSI
jgi:hypothetical protein